jgi:hypothetical protein
MFGTEKSKLTQRAYKKGHKIRREEPKVLQIDPHSTYGEYKQFANRSQSTHLGQLSYLDSHFRSSSKKITIPPGVD